MPRPSGPRVRVAAPSEQVLRRCGRSWARSDSRASAHRYCCSRSRNGIAVLNSEFVVTSQEARSYRQYIIVRNDRLEYPICLYRISETEYVALLMRCTHQGTELQAFGDHLQCPAHGSEFNNRGQVSQGPAENNLRTFRVTNGEEKLLIELK